MTAHLMKRDLISEEMVVAASRRGEKLITHPAGALITDAARDRAKLLGIKFAERKADAKPEHPKEEVREQRSAEVIAIGSDHGGYQLKELLKPHVGSLGFKVVDLGTYSEEACDYPDYAYAVARMVSLGEASKGIMIDSVGIASAIVANKLNGIRAAACGDEFSARSSREHNNANVLTLGGKVLGIELAKAIVGAWLSTNFGGGRHQKRVDKISEIEKRTQTNG